MRKNRAIFTVTYLVVLFTIVIPTPTVKAEITTTTTFNGVDYEEWNGFYKLTL